LTLGEQLISFSHNNVMPRTIRQFPGFGVITLRPAILALLCTEQKQPIIK
jgi:hypothetical protein